MSTNKRLPPAPELAKIVNCWLAAGRERAAIAAEWHVSWWAIQKSLHRAGYVWQEMRVGWFEREKTK